MCGRLRRVPLETEISSRLIKILKHCSQISNGSAVNYNVCELLRSFGNIYTVKLMHSNNSELIASGLSVNFNWPPEESDCSFSLFFQISRGQLQQLS